MKFASCIMALVYIVSSASFLCAKGYEHETKVKNMSFSWKINKSELQVKLSAKTTG